MSIDSMPLNSQEARSLSRCASRVLTLTYPTAPWTTFPWSVSARMRAAAPLPPTIRRTLSCNSAGSPPKPARDIRTHPPPDPAPPGARPAALALRQGGPQDRVVAAPAPASGAAPAGTPGHTSSTDRPSSPQACTTSGIPRIAAASPWRSVASRRRVERTAPLRRWVTKAPRPPRQRRRTGSRKRREVTLLTRALDEVEGATKPRGRKG